MLWHTMPEPSPNSRPRLGQPAPLQLNFKAILAIIIAGLVLIGVFTSYYTVEADSVAVVQRFGRLKPWLIQACNSRSRLAWTS
jgi:regulator of protease activity HflC (stomatin/prohibitin superfamily)